MKRVVIGLLMLALLMSAGCSRAVKNSQNDTPLGSEEKTVETYEDETHKNIQYETLSFSIGSYHIVSHSSSGDVETFKCEIDKGEGYSWTKTHMTITVQAIKDQDFLDTDRAVAYLCDTYPNHDKMKIYSEVAGSSGIISLYMISEGDQTSYVVCYKEAYYLIESDVDEIYLLDNYPSEYYEVHNQKIECANSIITTVNATLSYRKDEFEKAEYTIIQGKDGRKYSAELSCEEGYRYHFTLNDENGGNLLTLSTEGASFNEVIHFLDVNRDGYADIRFLLIEGTMNNSYELYVWDDSAMNFIKVKCDEMLSYFEVHDGYLQNWQKESANSGVIQKLVWNKNTLVKESEEPYQAD